MIFVQPFCDNFWTAFSLILTRHSYSLSIVFDQYEEKKAMLSPKLSSIGCTNISAQQFYTQSEYP